MLEPVEHEWLFGKTHRWLSEDKPICVLVSPYYYYDDKTQLYKIDRRWSRELTALVQRALCEWEKASAGRLSFQLIENVKTGIIHITWRLPSAHRRGSCGNQLLDNNIIGGSKVDIATPKNIAPNDLPGIYSTILHELGHALGLGHAKQENNIMHPSSMRTASSTLSKNVIETLNWVYDHTPSTNYYGVGRKLGLGKRPFLFDVIAALSEQDETSIIKTTYSNEIIYNQLDLMAYTAKLQFECIAPSNEKQLIATH